MTDIKAIEKVVDDLLASVNVKFSASYIGERKREDWQCDKWECTFSKETENQHFDFYTGLGHRKSAVKMPADIARLGKNILLRVQWEKVHIKPVKPCAANVLYSLILDSSALDTNFGDWASDFGYDSDSIKALTTYNACCAEGRKLHKLFDRETIAKLSEILQDY